uniref:Transglutaminase 4 n=1 Tax=Varanus komodoensis TaxID=61221 RepID=A0A8D2IH06_VARKO
ISRDALGVDFLREENTRLHHTNAYNNKSLIARHGQPFCLKVTFNRLLKDNDQVKLQLSIGKQATFGPLQWPVGYLIYHIMLCNTMMILSDAIIGKYLLKVKTGSNIYSPNNNFVYILFNPWCEADTVFMPNDDERAEYVLNDTGYIYVGSAKNILGRPWNFGQFEEEVLDCCMYLLDKSKLKPNARKNPVIISRAMSALVNSEDDHGVLFANWSGHYPGGTPPLAWTGSVPILQQYYRTKTIVLYAQCWVFSGVLTTVMRSLGIPARSVTNFASAHDTDQNLRVDVYLNENGEKLSRLSRDSIWNFHVWNDVWMKRPDLPKGFDGWQAIDSTPQEASQGIYQCGPCPLKAIKNGDVYLPYDGKFLFAEVNADKVFWLVKNKKGAEKYVKLREETKVIGKNISTKAVGKNIREDITAQYKFSEGDPEERKAVENACKYLQCDSLADTFDKDQAKDCKAALKVEMESEKALWPGQPIDLNIVVKNESAGDWTVHFAASCQLESYTGKVEESLATIKQVVQTEGKPVVQIPLKIAPDVYIKALMGVEDELMVRVNVLADIQETEEKLAEEWTLNFQYPPLKVEMAETAKINQDFTCAFIFKNTLSIPLENCKLYVEGLGIFMMEIFDQGDIAPGGIFKSMIVCAPRKTGLKKIVAKLNSNQLKGITVEKFISITE